MSAHLGIGNTDKDSDGLDDKVVLLCLFNQVLGFLADTIGEDKEMGSLLGHT